MLQWIETPDDIAGHKAISEAIAPIKVATGEMCQNRIMFKQFIKGGAVDIVQIDSCRMGGLNEVLVGSEAKGLRGHSGRLWFTCCLILRD